MQADRQVGVRFTLGADKPEDEVSLVIYLIHAQGMCLPEDEENESEVFR